MWKAYASLFVRACASTIVSASGRSSSSGDNSDSEDATGVHMDGGMAMDGKSPMRVPPTSIAIAPIANDAVFVINGGDSSISVLDPAMKQVVGTIKLRDASFPHHIYASHDRKTLAVAVPGMDMSGGHTGGEAGMRGAVMILDGRTGATKVSRLLDAMNHNAAFSPKSRIRPSRGGPVGRTSAAVCSTGAGSTCVS